MTKTLSPSIPNLMKRKSPTSPPILSLARLPISKWNPMVPFREKQLRKCFQSWWSRSKEATPALNVESRPLDRSTVVATWRDTSRQSTSLVWSSTVLIVDRHSQRGTVLRDMLSGYIVHRAGTCIPGLNLNYCGQRFSWRNSTARHVVRLQIVIDFC